MGHAATADETIAQVDKENHAPVHETWREDTRTISPIAETCDSSSGQVEAQLGHQPEESLPCPVRTSESSDVGGMSGLRTPERASEPSFTTGSENCSACQ